MRIESVTYSYGEGSVAAHIQANDGASTSIVVKVGSTWADAERQVVQYAKQIGAA